jgi:hypothetical protein
VVSSGDPNWVYGSKSQPWDVDVASSQVSDTATSASAGGSIVFLITVKPIKHYLTREFDRVY